MAWPYAMYADPALAATLLAAATASLPPPPYHNHHHHHHHQLQHQQAGSGPAGHLQGGSPPGYGPAAAAAAAAAYYAARYAPYPTHPSHPAHPAPIHRPHLQAPTTTSTVAGGGYHAHALSHQLMQSSHHHQHQLPSPSSGAASVLAPSLHFPSPLSLPSPPPALGHTTAYVTPPPVTPSGNYRPELSSPAHSDTSSSEYECGSTHAPNGSSHLQDRGLALKLPAALQINLPSLSGKREVIRTIRSAFENKLYVQGAAAGTQTGIGTQIQTPSGGNVTTKIEPPKLFQPYKNDITEKA